MSRTRSGLLRTAAGFIGAAALLVGAAPAMAQGLPTTDDPRVGLAPGVTDAGSAIKGLSLLSNTPKPTGFEGASMYNSDAALQGNYAFMGNYNGFNIYDISTPSAPVLKTSVVCPGGQGDLSVYGNLLFMSVEQTSAKIDCTSTPAATTQTRFRGVRIFDISNIAAPVQVGGVQTCRGSHTHTLVEAPEDPENVYIYVSGTASVRSATELAGCSNGNATSEDPSRWRIEIIKVPLKAPQTASVVNAPRLFANPETGAIDGLQNSPPPGGHPAGGSFSPSPVTDACHDITVYEDLGLAAGACEGNGILLDISDPVNPVRIDAVADPLFSYWHGATFSEDGKAVVFTDEWGGGSGARCRATDQLSWGADAIYAIENRKLVFKSYYKLPTVQTNQENCVSHVGNLIPIPGRNVMAQAWYQGGVSVFDFTDLEHPKEIAYFDRGPINPTSLVLAGYWSTYWHNGVLIGSEIGRGLDVFKLAPTEDLTAEEIAAAESFTQVRTNAQNQQAFTKTDVVESEAGGTVPATLSLSLSAGASFGAFTPGVAQDYEASTSASVISTAGDAALSVSDPSTTAPGHLVNGTFTLPAALQAKASSTGGTGGDFAPIGDTPAGLLTYSGPVTNDSVALAFKQSIGASDALRTGSYSKTLTFTLSTTNP